MKKNRIFASSSEQKANPFLFGLKRASRPSNYQKKLLKFSLNKLTFYVRYF